MDTNKLPKNLLAATRYFADPDVCVDLVAAMRWPDGRDMPALQRQARLLPQHAANLEVHGQGVPQAVFGQDF